MSGGDGDGKQAAGGLAPEPPGGTLGPAVRDPPSIDPTAPAPEPTRSAAPPDLPVVPAAYYEMEGEHARGGLGRILRARDRRLDRPVAVKQLLQGGEGEARFVREARI